MRLLGEPRTVAGYARFMTSALDLRGVWVPLITPFDTSGDVDIAAIERLCGEYLDAGVSGIVALGTTGEAPALDAEEKHNVIDACSRVCAARGARLIVGTGTNGTRTDLATPEEIHAALEQAFDYRGDVLITRKDGSKIEGYIFDRNRGKSLADSYARLLPKDGSGKVAIAYIDIAALAFTGRDMAAGKSWENWVKQYWEKKAAGETDISLQPEELE